MFKPILFLAASLLVVEAHHHRIVDGSVAKKGQFPHIAMIRANGGFYCGGSIIGDNIILTAAHCLVVEVDEMTITLGAHELHDSGVTYEVESMHSHPDYITSPQTRHDVGIVILKNNIQFDEYTKKIELHTGSPYDFTEAVAAGWGNIHGDKEGHAPVLKYANVKLMDQESCAAAKGHPADQDFCVTSEHGNVCYGDSGGPLTAEGKLIGLTSWGWYPCGIQNPGVFARIDVHMDFIQPYLES